MTAAQAPGADSQPPDEVALTLPADSGYVALLRSVTAGLAARCDLTIDEIEDLRIAVDEACALLLPHALAAAGLDVHFTLHPECIEIMIRVQALASAAPDRTGFAWTVLGALASDVQVQNNGSGLSIALTKRRGAFAE